MEYSPKGSDFYSNTPTAVIPTENGAMWQRVDPYGNSDRPPKPRSPVPYPYNYNNESHKPDDNSRLDDSINLYPEVNIRNLTDKTDSQCLSGAVETNDHPLVQRHTRSLPLKSNSPLSNSYPQIAIQLTPSIEDIPEIPTCAENNKRLPTISEAVSARSCQSLSSNLDSRPNSRLARLHKQVNSNRMCRLILWWAMAFCALNIFFILFGYDKLVDSIATSKLTLHEYGPKYDAWASSPMPLYYKVVVFNMTNPRAFMRGSRPRVHECGPYVYRMFEEKVDVKFHDNGTVSYRTKPTYYFEPDLSEGSEDDVIWTVNIPFINAADAVKNSAMLKFVVNYASQIHGFETLRRLSIKELLWGHKSKVLDWGRMFQDLPYPHPDFGLLVGMNNTAQQPYTMFTGAGDPHRMNMIHSWNGKTKLDFWEGDSCNQISGTDASGFSPGVSPADTLHIFNGQLCRTIPLVYERNVVQNGIDAYRFSPPYDVFSYGPQHPENSCFCPHGECPPQGILDMKPCYFGAAVAFSFPHFYKAQPFLRHMVLGMKPDPEKHSTEFDIFPELGVPLRVKLRMQMNVVLDKNQALQRARHFDLIYPIFWFEAGIDSLPSGIVSQLRMAQTFPPIMKTVMLCASGVFAIIFLLLLTAQTFMNMFKSGLSSIRSRSPKGSEHDTRSTTPDLSSVGQGSDQHISGDLSKENVNSYTPFTVHQSLDNEGLGELVDNHTLLPAYKRRGSDPPQKKRVTGTFSDPTDYPVAEPSADNDEYPPTYQAITSDTNIEAPGSAHSVMEHKPISTKAPVIQQLVTKTAPPIAPLATVEDLTAPGDQLPLATSSPQISADDIEVTVPNSMKSPNTSANLSPGGYRVGAAPNTLPRVAPNRTSHNTSLPPPLESDL